MMIRTQVVVMDRPYRTRPTWELENMIKALSLLPWFNTEEDNARRDEARRELMIRRGIKI